MSRGACVRGSKGDEAAGKTKRRWDMQREIHAPRKGDRIGIKGVRELYFEVSRLPGTTLHPCSLPSEKESPKQQRCWKRC